LERVLLIGFGHAGKRFYRVLNDVQRDTPSRVRLTGVCDSNPRRLSEVPRPARTFRCLDTALAETRATTAVVAVNEVRHFDVLRRCAAARVSRILCEKPLAASNDEARELSTLLAGTTVTVNLLERHSPVIADYLRWAAEIPGLAPKRVEFFWGKHRLRDPRPTIGVMSEAIHALDLVNYLFRPASYEVVGAHGVSSDFSHAPGAVLDTLDVVLRMPGFVVLGHCSFAWPWRQRTLTALLTAPDGRLFRATFDFDAPHWDLDSLKIVSVDLDDGRYETVLETTTDRDQLSPQLAGVNKLSRFVRMSLAPGHTDGPMLVDTSEALALQAMLDALERALSRQTVIQPPMVPAAAFADHVRAGATASYAEGGA
jgi:predicted dehydrogenase